MTGLTRSVIRFAQSNQEQLLKTKTNKANNQGFYHKMDYKT